MWPQAGQIIGLIIAAILSGWIEYVVYRDGFRSTGNRFPKRLFTWSYHWPIISLWFLMCLIAWQPWFIFAYAWLQDMSWYAFNPKERLGPDCWVNWKLSGNWIKGRWIPNTYILLILASFIGYWLQFYYLK